MRRWLLQLVLLQGILVLAQPAGAERFHVRVGGTRSEGASEPGEWSEANCYPDLAAAASRISPADTLLLYREAHDLATPVLLGAYLGNADLDDDSDDCELHLTGWGELYFSPAQPHAEIAGVRFRGDGDLREPSALILANHEGTIATVAMRGCVFEDFFGGREPRGGACLHASAGRGLELRISSCEFRNNRARGRGGALRINDGFEVIVENSEFTGNRALDGSLVAPGGGALAVWSPDVPTHATVRDCRFVDNASMMTGGAIDIVEGGLVLENCEIEANRSAWGGDYAWSAGAGVLLRRAEGSHDEPIALHVADCVFTDNAGDLTAGQDSGDGGAILVKGDHDRPVAVTIERSDFFANFNAQGGGLYMGRFATGVVSYCRFHENGAQLSGGGAFKGGAFAENLGETATFVFCEFVGNRAGFDREGDPVEEVVRGGAFATRLHPRGEFHHCTFLDNIVGGVEPFGDAIGLKGSGGEFDDDMQRCVLVNTVFYGEGGHDVEVRANPQGFSRVENCAFGEGQYVCPGVPAVASVTLEGFPFATGTNLMPAIRSPLVDAGQETGLSPDLNGYAVPQGDAPDIGGYEYVFLAAVPSRASRLLRQNVPNPFNPQTVIPFELPARAPVSLTIYDLSGRVVRRLLAGTVEARGNHEASWNGRDDRGRAVAAGVYFYRLETESRTETRRMTLVR